MIEAIKRFFSRIFDFGQGTAEAITGGAILNHVMSEEGVKAIQAVADSLEPGEAPSEGLSILLTDLSERENGRHRHLLSHLWSYLMDPRRLERLHTALGWHYKDLRDGTCENTPALIDHVREVTDTRGTGRGRRQRREVERTQTLPPGYRSPREQFVLTWIEILEWQQTNADSPIIDAAISFLLKGRAGRVERAWKGLKRLLGISDTEASVLERWAKGLGVAFLGALLLTCVAMVVAFAMRNNPDAYAFWVIVATFFGSLVAAALGMLIGLLFTAPGGLTAKDVFFRITTALIAGLLSISIFWFLKPEEMSGWSVTLMALSGLAWLTLLVRKVATEESVPMGRWGKVLGIIFLIAAVWGISEAVTPKTAKQAAGDWVHHQLAKVTPRFGDGGEANRQLSNDLGRSGVPIERRGRKQKVDGDTGRPLKDLTPEAYAATQQLFDPYSGKVNRKCFDDPVTGRIIEVYDVERNFDVNTRTPLRWCTEEDAKALSAGTARGASYTARPSGYGNWTLRGEPGQMSTIIDVPSGAMFDLHTVDPSALVTIRFKKRSDGRWDTRKVGGDADSHFDIGNIDKFQFGVDRPTDVLLTIERHV